MWEVGVMQARTVMDRAYARYSGFYVGACVMSESGKLYAGCNVENVSYSLTVCAETCAIAQMVAGGEVKIKAISVICYGNKPCSPCGACRQRIAEFAAPDVPVYMSCVCDSGKVLHEVCTIAELLPGQFDAAFLNE